MKLKKDRNLIIKESDQGGACVIIANTYCKETIETMLQDETTYKEIHNGDRNRETLLKIKKTNNKIQK